MSICKKCGHQHQGKRHAYICIGCPCQEIPPTKCANGCDAHVCPPSKVICKACIDKITAKLDAWAETGKALP